MISNDVQETHEFHSDSLVVWNMFYVPIDWEQSSQLTNIFSEGFKPQTSYGLFVIFFEGHISEKELS